jgi:putative PIN family toxin of toxin-antitoxin system
LRVVLDVNVFVSALISRAGAPARLLELWLDGGFEIVVSDALLAELERTLAYSKVRRRVDANDAARFIALLRQLGEVVPEPDEAPLLRSPDPGDDYLLALAAHERVSLVSGDEHLLSLRDRAPVLSPREFLNLLAQD